MKTVVVIEVIEAEDEVLDHLEFMKKQINRYSQGLMDYKVFNVESDLEVEITKKANQDGHLGQHINKTY